MSWSRVADWPEGNQTPLKLGAAVRTPAPPPIGNPFDVYARLGEEMRGAMEEMRAAESLIDEISVQLAAAKAEHSKACGRIKTLREQAAKALALIDGALVGTARV